RVFAADGMKPLPDAVVLLSDERGRELGQAKTDANGAYTVAIPIQNLHLKTHKGGGGMQGLLKGVGKVLAQVQPVIGAPTGLPGIPNRPSFANINTLNFLTAGGKGGTLQTAGVAVALVL